MPELPEVETIARDLDRKISGRTVTSVTVTRPNVLREAGARTFRKRLPGATILRSWRRAKLVVTDFSTGDRLVVQPRFTGAMIVAEKDTDPDVLRYSTVRLDLDDGRALHYCDVRRLGTVTLMPPGRFAEYTGRLGIEPLDREFTPARLSGLLRASSQAVKKLLMDQLRIAGIGNIYANEALWRARIDPSRRASTVPDESVGPLRDAIVSVLKQAVKARGTSFRDYRDSSGEEGGYAIRLDAYGRAGLPCRRCGSRLVGTHAIDGRQTVLCVRCQA